MRKLLLRHVASPLRISRKLPVTEHARLSAIADYRIYRFVALTNTLEHQAPHGRAESAFEAPALVSSFDDVAVVGQAIEQRGRHLGITEDARHG
jgi:hypothetical protein